MPQTCVNTPTSFSDRRMRTQDLETVLDPVEVAEARASETSIRQGEHIFERRLLDRVLALSTTPIQTPALAAILAVGMEVGEKEGVVGDDMLRLLTGHHLVTWADQVAAYGLVHTHRGQANVLVKYERDDGSVGYRGDAHRWRLDLPSSWDERSWAFTCEPRLLKAVLAALSPGAERWRNHGAAWRLALVLVAKGWWDRPITVQQAADLVGTTRTPAFKALRYLVQIGWCAKDGTRTRTSLSALHLEAEGHLEPYLSDDRPPAGMLARIRDRARTWRQRMQRESIGSDMAHVAAQMRHDGEGFVFSRLVDRLRAIAHLESPTPESSRWWQSLLDFRDRPVISVT